jgi:hypothetical protein
MGSMETEKLFVATLPSEVRSLFEMRRRGIEWDGSEAILQETARKVWLTFHDSQTVQLIHPESRKPVSWDDLVRVANIGVPSTTSHEEPVRKGISDDSLPGSIRASVFPGAQNVDGIPWGTTSGNDNSGYIPVLALSDSPSKIQFGPDTTWSTWTKILDSCRSLQHPFTDMVITDQYIMSRSDEYLCDCLVPLLTSLRVRDQETPPRISLISSSKRFGDHPPAASPDEVAADDLLRLKTVYPAADWSAVYVDLFGLSTKKKEIARNVAEFLHGRYVTTSAIQIQFDPGLDVLRHRKRNGVEVVEIGRNGMPMLRSGSISIAGSFDDDGRTAILDYVNRMRSCFAGILLPGNSVGVAGSIERNRLVSSCDR